MNFYQISKLLHLQFRLKYLMMMFNNQPAYDNIMDVENVIEISRE